MADAKTITVTAPNGSPLVGGLAGMTLTYLDTSGGAQSAAGVLSELGAGEYQVAPTDADEAAGRVAFLDTGAGNSPRFVTFAIFKGDRSNQFWAWHLEDPTAAETLWTSAAPTFGAGSYLDRSSGVRTPPAILALAGAYLYIATPSAGDVAAETTGRIDAPGVSPLTVSTEPIVATSGFVPPASTGALPDPATDLAAYLSGLAISAASLTLTQGVNLFAGPMRSLDRSPTTCTVWVLNSGGAFPLPYLNGGRKSLSRPTVQVMVRGARGEYRQAEIVARAVYEALHQQTIGSYVSILARDAAPAPLGIDVNDMANFVTNFECAIVVDLP